MVVCLVTGGAGFIGSHLVESLVARGHRVRALDNFSTGDLGNLISVRHDIELIFGDLSNLQTAKDAIRGVDIVFHLASSPVWRSGAIDPLGSQLSDSTETLHVLIAAHEANVKRVVYASSYRVYGVGSPFPLSETTEAKPLSPYAVSKWTGEQQCAAFAANYGVETVALRYFDVFGPRQSMSSHYAGFLLTSLKAMLVGKSPILFGDGLGPRDLIYVDDVTHANILASEAPRVAGKVYNIGRGRPTTQLDVVSAINSILGTAIRPFHVNAGLHNEMPFLANISKAEAELGFCPGTDLEHGCRKWIETFSTWRADVIGLEKSRTEGKPVSP